MSLSDGDTFERSGRKFRVRIVHDDNQDTPWEREDGHGPVSKWTSRAKAPGELVLASDRPNRHRYYDMSEAVKIANREGWGGKGRTKRQRAASAAQADYERLLAWCEDQWSYVGVVVQPVCKCCGAASEGYRFALWGIESDAGDYLTEVANDLADEAIEETPDHAES